MKRKIFVIAMSLLVSINVISCDSPANETTKNTTASATSAEVVSIAQRDAEKRFAENEEISLNLSYGKRTGAYTGQLKDGLPHGEGTFTSVNPYGGSWVYRGQWSNGHCNGQGCTIWDSGQIEIGNYVNDVLQGDALALSKDGKIYKGEFINGTPSSTVSILSELTDTDSMQETLTESIAAEATVPETEEAHLPKPPEVTTADITMGMRNALNKAHDYLNFSAFSYSGLIEQLEYEGFSTEEATFAVDSCGADWNEQAAKKAQDYLKLSSFSRSGLIDQLKYEGFTNEQAEYGASAAGY